MPFRLEKILNLRLKEEEAFRQELVSVRRRISETEEEIRKTEQERRTVEDQLRSGQITGAQVGFYLYALRLLSFRLEELRRRLNSLRNEEEHALKRFLEKRTERKSLEKLKERYVLRELSEADRKQRALIDEIAIQKFFRTSSE